MYLPKILVEDILSILRDFDAHKAMRAASFEILALNRVAEGARTEILKGGAAAGNGLLILCGGPIVWSSCACVVVGDESGLGWRVGGWSVRGWSVGA